jgi:hypothetical protein
MYKTVQNTLMKYLYSNELYVSPLSAMKQHGFFKEIASLLRKVSVVIAFTTINCNCLCILIVHSINNLFGLSVGIIQKITSNEISNTFLFKWRLWNKCYDQCQWQDTKEKQNACDRRQVYVLNVLMYPTAWGGKHISPKTSEI